MRKSILLIPLLTALAMLAGCGTAEDEESAAVDSTPLPPATAKVAEGDFSYKLETEKDVYDEYGDTAIMAELSYTGADESVTIYHAASPFHFSLEEKTRGYDVPGAMTAPLIATTIKKGEPLRQRYQFSGGFSDQDDEQYVEFIETVMKEGFPVGDYIIHGSAQFFTRNDKGEEEQEFQMEGEIGFTVRKPPNH